MNASRMFTSPASLAATLIAACTVASSAGASVKEPSRVVFVHGIFQSGRIFAPLVRKLEAQGCECLVPKLKHAEASNHWRSNSRRPSTNAGATAKALLVMGGPLGLLLCPLAVSLTRKMHWKASTGAAAVSWTGGAAFLVAALSGDLRVFVPACMIGMMSLTMGIPMLTQIYQENYPASERGDLFSKAVMVRVLSAAAFAWVGGLWLDAHMDGYRLLMLAFAAASGMGAWWIGKCPSTVLHAATSSNPLHGMRHVRSDKLFRWLLASWMLMGFGNLLMLPLRVEFLANPRYGIELSPPMIALVVAMIPSLTNLVFARFWGRLFDRMNFFLLRIVLNAFFVAATRSYPR